MSQRITTQPGLFSWGARIRKAALLFGVFAVAALVYATNEPWKTKPYQQWNANDVKQVLWNSPWVKDISVPAGWPAPQESLAAGQLQGANQSAGSIEGGSHGGSMGDSQNAPPVSSGAADGTIERRDVAFYVRWNSALAVREGFARQAVLSGQMSEDRGQQYLRQPQTTYQVQVSGSDMIPFLKETSDTLKAKTYFEIKPSKKRVSPSDVEFTRNANGTIAMVLFSFPRQDQNGQPLITSSDKEVRLDCKLKDMYLDAGFDLRKMVGPAGPDI